MPSATKNNSQLNHKQVLLFEYKDKKWEEVRMGLLEIQDSIRVSITIENIKNQGELPNFLKPYMSAS